MPLNLIKPTVLFTDHSINQYISKCFAYGAKTNLVHVNDFSDFNHSIAVYGYLRGAEEVKSLQQKYPNSKFIVGDGKQSFWSEIFKNNKAIIDSKQINDYKDIIWIKNYPNHRPYRIYDKKTHTIK